MPLAAVLPADLAVLVESVGKKARFLQAAAEATGLEARVQVAARRVEDLAAESAHRERWPAVLARAVGSLAELVELAFPLLERGGHLIAWKGDLSGDELAAGRRAVVGLGGGHVAVVPSPTPGQPRNRLVIATKRGATASAFPRNPATRKRRPW
jgi:16S rRNA (guanine527-N7)-methyltransferase